MGPRWVLPFLGNGERMDVHCHVHKYPFAWLFWVFMDTFVAMDPFRGLTLTQELLSLAAEIDEFKGRWQALGVLAPDRLAALRRIATLESIGSSTRIEGAKLSDEEVDRLLSGLDIRSFRSRDEQEVAGYAKAMDLVFDGWQMMSLTENHIRQLHGTLLSYSEKDERHRGEYKKLANHVEAFDENGKSLGIIFQTGSPFDTPRLMTELIAWTHAALDFKAYHRLLVIGVFVVRFLAIHPFQDGNGRLSRIITTLLLLRAGYEYVPYSSLERVVEENKDGYYRALRRGQGTLDKGESQLGEWLLFFLQCLTTQKNGLARKVERERLMAQLPPLAAELLRLAREHGRLTVSTAVAATGGNRSTVKLHLRQLAEDGKLVLHGQRRGAWYEPA
ncbi:MAG: Fic family protein [Myxococcaceae bacterium]